MELSGPQKAVLMLLSLDEALATPILGELDPADVRRLREAATSLRAVPVQAMEGLYKEFVERTQEAVAVPRGGVRYLRRIAGKALGEPAANAIFVDSKQPALERIAATDPSTLAGVMEHEHPQLVAAILGQLDHKRAARVLDELPEVLRPAGL
jgi:flagellar motor switch protein FliG